MRRFVKLALVALAAGTMPAMVRAEGANQEAATQISNQLRDSGQLGGRKISVRYFNGTVWLQGEAASQDQANKLVAAVMATPGVTINRVIPDGLAVAGARSEKSTQGAARFASTTSANPLRSSETNRAQPVAIVFFSTGQGCNAGGDDAGRSADSDSCSGGVANGRGSGRQHRRSPCAPLPMYAPGTPGGVAPVRYDHPAMPGYAWPSYAAYPNYAAVTYPKQYSPTAWPYIGPFYPYPQVPLGWRKVSMQWDDGWWWLDFKDKPNCCWWR